LGHQASPIGVSGAPLIQGLPAQSFQLVSPQAAWAAPPTSIVASTKAIGSADLRNVDTVSSSACDNIRGFRC
jgi:hypothetical protein